MGFKNKILHVYDKKYKQLLLIPLLLLVFSFAVIGFNYYKHGDFIQKGISLKGGTTVMIQKEGADITDLLASLQQKLGTREISVRELTSTGRVTGVVVDASDINPDELVSAIKEKYGNDVQLTVETIGEALGNSFFKEAIRSLIIAFAFMALVVFIYFRDIVPAGYVVLSAFTDIVFAIALTDLFNIKVETAGIAAFLMLIGYSVDTDILLTARVLKGKEGTVFDKIVGSMKTGFTMTFAAIAATSIAYFFTPSEVLKQIMMILLFGLIADIPATWFMNAGLLRMHMHDTRGHK